MTRSSARKGEEKERGAPAPLRHLVVCHHRLVKLYFRPLVLALSQNIKARETKIIPSPSKDTSIGKLTFTIARNIMNAPATGRKPLLNSNTALLILINPLDY
jgi:hypothetical protein